MALLLLLLTGAVAQAQQYGPGYWERTPLPQQGVAAFYAPGMMEYVYDYRARQGDISECPECVGTVALLRAGDIGRRVWLKPPAGDPVGPFLVIDCARRQDVQPLLDRNWVVDVSYEVGQLWGMKRPLDGVLVFEDPAEPLAEPVRPASSVAAMPTRFYVDPAQVLISAPTATPEPPAAMGEGAAPAALPTPWPTRMPVPLPGVTVEPVVIPSPTAVLPPTPTPGPPPLTPIITTPTPVYSVPEAASTSAPAPPTASAATGAADAPVVSGGLSLVATPVSTTVAPEPEMSLGRAGAGLLDGDPAPALFASALATPTALRVARTPRPDVTPILRTETPTPTPAAGTGESFWDRILREIRDLLD